MKNFTTAKALALALLCALPASVAASGAGDATRGPRGRGRHHCATSGVRDPGRRVGGDRSPDPRVRISQRLARRAVHVGRGCVGAPEGA